MAEAKPKKATCVWANVWTSKGQVRKGEEVELPADEYKALKEKGAIK